MKKLLIIVLVFLLVGCTKTEANPKSKEDEAIEITNAFFNAISNSDFDKAATYLSEDVVDDILYMGLDGIIETLREAEYPEEAILEYIDYSKQLRKKMFNKISNFKIDDVFNDEIGYMISGTIDTIDTTELTDFLLENDLNEEDYQEVTSVYLNEGIDKALILYMQKLNEMNSAKADIILQETKAETVPIYIYLEDTENGLKITDIDSLFAYNSYYGTAEDYNSHGISTKLDEGWYELSYEESQGSTYAVANDYFKNTTYCELHFSEQLAMGSKQDYDDYVKNDLPDIVKENFSAYDTCDVEVVTVSIGNNDYLGIHVDASANGNHIYEMDIPVHTNDDNITMIAILTYYDDLSYDVLKLVNIE